MTLIILIEENIELLKFKGSVIEVDGGVVFNDNIFNFAIPKSS